MLSAFYLVVILLPPLRADILSEDYSLKRTLKMKHTTPHGLTVTAKNEHKKGVAGFLEAKYNHPKSGAGIDKAKVLKSRRRTRVQ